MQKIMELILKFLFSLTLIMYFPIWIIAVISSIPRFGFKRTKKEIYGYILDFLDIWEGRI
jgi:hypothetical protein